MLYVTYDIYHIYDMCHVYIYMCVCIYIYMNISISYPRERVLGEGSWSRLEKGHGAARRRVMEPLGEGSWSCSEKGHGEGAWSRLETRLERSRLEKGHGGEGWIRREGARLPTPP